VFVFLSFKFFYKLKYFKEKSTLNFVCLFNTMQLLDFWLDYGKGAQPRESLLLKYQKFTFGDLA